MLYKTVHTTRYLYDTPVSQCVSEVRLTPRSLPWQTVIEASIRTLPRAATFERRTDYFGNVVTALAILEGHERFFTVASSTVRVEPRPVVQTDATWEDVREALARRQSDEALEATEFMFDSPYVSADPELAAFARPSFPAGRPVLDAVDDLSRRIHTEFSYAPKSTSVDTPLLEALRARKGVCQDFSHVMIGALRSLDLAARYVSGYLRSGEKYLGSEASHAWVSVWVGSGWVDVDPTNNLRPDTNHVTLAWGRDYADVTPVKGIALGGGSQTIEVDVRVEPIPEPQT